MIKLRIVRMSLHTQLSVRKSELSRKSVITYQVQKMDESVVTDLEITLLSKGLRRKEKMVEEMNDNHSSQISINTLIITMK